MDSQASGPDACPTSLRQKLQTRGQAVWRSPRVRKRGLIFVGLLALSGLLAYLWLPSFLHAKLEQVLAGQLERPVTLGKVEVQPFRLEVTVRDLRIGNREGDQPLAGFGALTVNVSSASLWQLALVFDALRLERPYVHLVRQADGRTNVSDLIEKFASTDEEKQPTPAFAINNLEISAGRFTLDDKANGSRHEIADLHLGVPRLASFPGEVERLVQPHFSATLDGAPINVAGEVRPFSEPRDGRLKLKVEGLDLARLAAFSPVRLPVQLKSAKLDGDLLLDFRNGSNDDKLALYGQLGLRQVQARIARLDARLGRLDFKLEAPDLLHAPIRLDTLKLEQLALQRQGEAQAFFSLAGMKIDRLSLDTGKRQLGVGTLGLDRLDLKLVRNSPDSLDVLDTMSQIQASLAPENGPSAAPAAPAWRWTVAGVKLSQAKLEFIDQTVDNPVPLRLHGLDLDVGALASQGGAAIHLELGGKVNENGSLAVAGQINPEIPSGELTLDISSLDLVPLQGWMPHHFNLVLSRGAASARGQIKFGGAPFNVSYQGQGRLADLSLLDKETSRSLLRWQNLDLTGLDFDTEPLKVKLEDAALTRFFARLMVTPQGRFHLGQLMGNEAGPPKAAAPASPSQVSSAPLPGEAPVSHAAAPAEQVAALPARSAPLPVRIGRIRLEGGTVLFNDLFIKPSYKANLTGLTGQIGPLAAGERGKLKIEGKVDKTAPLMITGELEPFSKELFLDIKAQARGIDMPSFSPYSGRYMGYLIQKGKLSADVSYHIENGLLEAGNHLFLDQFTLGEPVDSPDALAIPIKMGLALLKNSRGEIEIDLPISGSINDPQFSIGGILLKAIMSLLVKAVTSPFTLLGSLFGGGEELSHVEFDPGLSALSPEAEKRLQALSKALIDRPALTLEVTGMADPVADSEGYRRVLLARQVKAKKVAADVAQGKSAARIGELTLTPQEYEKYLTQLYKEAKFDKPRNMIGLTKSLPVHEMETLLVTHMELDESAFNELAARRGKLVRDWLVEQGQVPSERIFVMAPEVGKGDPASPANRVAFSLR